MARKPARKSIVQQVKDAVDHVLHPEPPKYDVYLAKSKKAPKKKDEKSSAEKSDYASHPKFAKFKSIQGAE